MDCREATGCMSLTFVVDEKEVIGILLPVIFCWLEEGALTTFFRMSALDILTSLGVMATYFF